jgi:hypothetical protein
MPKKELTDKQKQTRAKQADKLLKNPLLVEAFEDVKAAIHQQIENLPPSDVDMLILCKERLHVLRSVEANLRQTIKTGQRVEFRTEEQHRHTHLGDLYHGRSSRSRGNGAEPRSPN